MKIEWTVNHTPRAKQGSESVVCSNCRVTHEKGKRVFRQPDHLYHTECKNPVTKICWSECSCWVGILAWTSSRTKIQTCTVDGFRVCLQSQSESKSSNFMVYNENVWFIRFNLQEFLTSENQLRSSPSSLWQEWSHQTELEPSHLMNHHQEEPRV